MSSGPKKRDYRPGQIIPGTVYSVVRHIATGGMGTVYDVEDITVGKRYVLKTLHPELCDRQDLVRRMSDEARALARLHHPNIVEVFTAGVTSDELKLPYYVMERLDGQSLRSVLEKKRGLELAHAYHIGIDLLDALDNAHDKNVVHRDVKPDNIFLHRNSATGTTVTKLLDFGIMRMIDGGRRETAGRFLGTLRYAAPEQIRGEELSARTDLYAAGLVLFEMVAGVGPFDDEGSVEKIGRAHLKTEAPLLSRFARVPEELDALIASALAKDPARRPRDAFTFAAELRALKRALQNKAAPNDRASHPTEVNVLAASMGESPLNPRETPSGRSTVTDAPLGLLVDGSTDPGMVAPPVHGATLEDAPDPAAPITTPDAVGGGSSDVDRQAPTRTSAYAEGPETPKNGTDPIPTAPKAGSPPADPYALTQRELPLAAGEAGSTVDTWSKGSSDPPRSRSPRAVSTESSRRPRSKVGLVVATLALVGLAAASILVIARASSTSLEASQPPALEPVPVSTETPAPPRIEPAITLAPAVAAPTLAPPTLDEPPPVVLRPRNPEPVRSSTPPRKVAPPPAAPPPSANTDKPIQKLRLPPSGL